MDNVDEFFSSHFVRKILAFFIYKWGEDVPKVDSVI